MTRPTRNTQDDLTAVAIALGAKHSELSSSLARAQALGQASKAMTLAYSLALVEQAIEEVQATAADPAQTSQG